MADQDKAKDAVTAWLNESEGFSLRIERLHEDAASGNDLVPWLVEAFRLAADHAAPEGKVRACEGGDLAAVVGICRAVAQSMLDERIQWRLDPAYILRLCDALTPAPQPEGQMVWVWLSPDGRVRSASNDAPSADHVAAANADGDRIVQYWPAAALTEITAQCCMCGRKNLSIIEGDGGEECQLADGRWTCSRKCWDEATEGTDNTALVEAAAKAIHDGPLCANDEVFDPKTHHGEWCIEVVKTVIAALAGREPPPAAQTDVQFGRQHFEPKREGDNQPYPACQKEAMAEIRDISGNWDISAVDRLALIEKITLRTLKGDRK